MGKKGIPDRWLDYQALGQCISGTKIVAFKVPLKSSLCQSALPKDEWFTPAMLLEKQPHLKTVIDLTNTHRYYNGQVEFGTKGIDHVKILVEGRGTIPSDSMIQRFYEAIDSHMIKYAGVSDALVGVHCTHGLNRTGYFICRWMVDQLKLDPDEAIARFNRARGHQIERKHLLDHLKLKTIPELPTLKINDEYRSPLDEAYEEPTYRSRYRDRPHDRRSRRDAERYRCRNDEGDRSRSRIRYDRRLDEDSDRSKKRRRF